MLINGIMPKYVNSEVFFKKFTISLPYDMNKGAIVGDTHGQNILMEEKTKNVDYIIHLGDSGLFFQGADKINSFQKPIFMAFGNHDHLDKMSALWDDNKVEIIKNCFVFPRGTVLFNFFNFGNTLFCGGGKSIDAERRQIGINYFDKEIPSYIENYGLPNVKVNTVFSHTWCESMLKTIHLVNPIRDQTSEYLEYVYNIYNPQRWYCGHFHMFHNVKINQCNFTALGDIPFYDIKNTKKWDDWIMYI